MNGKSMNGVTKEKPVSRPVGCVSLDDPEIVGGFSTLESTLRRCLGGGGGGGVAAVVSETGLSSLVCSSERLLAALPAPRPPLALATAAVRHQTAVWRDGGLAAGALLAGLLRRLLPLQAPRYRLRQALQAAAAVCLRAAAAQQLRLALEVPQLLGVVATVLRSKRMLGLTSSERRHLQLQLLRAFLLIVPAEPSADGQARLGQVHLQLVGSGSVLDSAPRPGLLLREPEPDDPEDDPDDPPRPSGPAESSEERQGSDRTGRCDEDRRRDEGEWERLEPERGRRRCLLFTPHLGSQDEALADTDLALSAAAARCFLSADRCLAALGRLPLTAGDVVACQRTVHPAVRRALVLRGAVVLERLGARGTALLAHLSGAQPLGGLSLVREAAAAMSGPEPEPPVGTLDGVAVRRIAGRRYVELTREGAPVVTLLVHCAQPEQLREEMKRQLESALFALHCLLGEPVVVPGGGCLETVLHAHLTRHARGKDQTTREVFGAMRDVLRQNALSIAGRPVLWSDAIYHHAWEAEVCDVTQDGTCVCGLVSARELRGRLSFSELSLSYFCEAEKATETDAAAPELDPHEITEDTLVDCARVKVGGLKTALEACHAILGIGMCLIEK